MSKLASEKKFPEVKPRPLGRLTRWPNKFVATLNFSDSLHNLLKTCKSSAAILRLPCRECAVLPISLVKRWVEGNSWNCFVPKWVVELDMSQKIWLCNCWKICIPTYEIAVTFVMYGTAEWCPFLAPVFMYSAMTDSDIICKHRNGKCKWHATYLHLF